MTTATHRTIRILAASALAALLAATGACGTTSGAQPTASTASTASTPRAAQYDTESAAQTLAEAMRETDPGMTMVESTGPAMARAVRNESDTDYPAATYKLTVGCLGGGALRVRWQLGDTGEESDTVECAPQAATRHYSVELDHTAHGAWFELEPTEGTDAQMAYTFSTSNPSAYDTSD